MHRSVSYPLAAILLLSSCGQTPTQKKDDKAPEVVAQTPTEPAKTATPVEAPTPTKKAATKKKAAPKEDKKLTSSERQQYIKALNEGRTAHRAKDFTAAIAAFDKALALFPDDPRALSEKGWSEFGAKDLRAAASDTNNAIGRTNNTDLLGSSYYNLGRIREDQAKTKEAIEAYQESLKVRPGNKIVKDRLTNLNAALVERGSLAGPFVTFTGPFASVEALCAEASKNDDASMKVRCELTATDPVKDDDESSFQKSITGSGAILSAKFFSTESAYAEGDEEPYFYPESSYHLALQTAEGWFLWTDVDGIYNPGAFGIFADLTVDQFEIKDLIPGGEPELMLSFSTSGHDSDMGINEVEMHSSSMLVVCGVGASKKPSCAKLTVKESAERGILLEDEEEALKKDDPTFKHEGFYQRSWALDWSFTSDGKLQIKGTPSKDMSAEAKSLIGTHTLAFE